MIRKAIFWTHLCCGVLTGIVVFTMSITGVLLTYERQMQAWAASEHYVPAAEQQGRLELEQLISLQQLAQPDQQASALVVSKDPGAPVTFRAGRRGGLALNPYSGEVMETGSPALEKVFSVLTGFHRWFNVEGENRALARQITGVSNLVFLFLVLSGMYLWLPAIYKWVLFKARLLFRGNYPDSKARDFHWHHIFGIWAAIPLVAVVYSGAVISYPWAANVMYRALGAEVPAAPAGPPPGQNQQGQNQQARGAGGAGRAQGAQGMPTRMGSAQQAIETARSYQSLQTLLDTALNHASYDWNRVTVNLPQADDATLTVEIDEGNGAQAQLRHTLTLNRSSGAVIRESGFSDIPLTQRLRTTARFLHTGEVLGFWGQTIAGLASFAALFLVWTGFALSYRRLIQPLLRKRKA